MAKMRMVTDNMEEVVEEDDKEEEELDPEDIGERLVCLSIWVHTRVCMRVYRSDFFGLSQS
jgi:hypothetical protein